MERVYIECEYTIKGYFEVPKKKFHSKNFDEWLFESISDNTLINKFADKNEESFRLIASCSER